MQIHPIEHYHVARCAELFLSVFNSPPWNETWSTATATRRLTDLFNTPGFYGAIAMDGAEATGFVMGQVEQRDRGRHFYLAEMCVVPHAQGRGTGTALLRALCRELVEAQVEKIYLLTARDGPATRFYASRGFYVSQKMVMMRKYLNDGACE